MQRDQAALVADADGSFSLLMPDLPEEAAPSEAVQLLVAVATRADDPLWVEEMIEFLHEQKQALEDCGQLRFFLPKCVSIGYTRTHEGCRVTHSRSKGIAGAVS